jgi:hypothetical protein
MLFPLPLPISLMHGHGLLKTLGSLQQNNAVKRGIWVATQFTLEPRKTMEKLDRVGSGLYFI